MPHAAAHSELSDEALMRALGSGQSDAIGPLYARYAPLILGMATNAVGRASAEEILQDVFLAVWRSASSFDPKRGPLKPWLLQIAHYRIANELRRRGRRPEIPADPEAAPLASVPDPAPDQSEQAWRAFRQSVLRRALDELPPAQRQALGLAFFDELTHEEVARALGLPLGTAKSRIRAGLAGLRLRLAPLIATALVIAAAAFLAARSESRRRELARDERALTMLTASDSQAIRLAAAPGVSPEAHATYRWRPGTTTAVLTLSHFPPLAPGKIDQAFLFHRGAWVSLGTLRPDASGRARLVVEATEVAFAPEALVVTIEPERGSAAPSGPRVVEWSTRGN